MGEVWKATDVRIDRTVALKVLPGDFFENEEKRARFAREARALASLNHPGIATLYSFEEIPGAFPVLSMELVEGETLAARLGKGALPLELALRWGAAIADALEAAHRRGIVHRDLKPTNVMVTRTGVKLLDFGLARSVTPAGEPLSGLETEAPAITETGVVVGTVPYMSPEQLEGKGADARTDVFALGSVLYEMLTGRRPFRAESRAALMSAILAARPPDVSSVRRGVPSRLDRVVATCLEKDPDARWQSAGDVAKELRWAAEDGEGVASRPSATRPRKRELAAWAFAALAILLAAATARPHRAAPRPTSAFKFFAPPGQSILAFASLSPDGRKILLLLRDDVGKNRLAVRALDRLDVRLLPGTENARGGFWSPDSREVAFFSDGKLRRTSADGGPAQVVCDSAAAVWGAWGPDGTILFARDFSARLGAVPASGGEPRAVTAEDPEDAHQNQPQFLPDGRHFVYLSQSEDYTRRSIRLGSLDVPETRVLFPTDSSALYVEPGWLFFARDSAVLAWRFDPKTLLLSGEPVPALDDVHWSRLDNFLSASAAGDRVAYVSWDLRRRLVWVDRKGRELGALGDVAGYFDVRISPDGRSVAVAVRDAAHGRTGDIWVLDSERGSAVRLTTETNDDFGPAWFPGGSRIAYASDRFGAYNLFARPATGGPEELLVRSERDKMEPVVFPDGRRVLAGVIREGLYERRILPLGGTGAPVDLSAGSRYSEEHAALSPDGRFTAFDSVESGRREVYLQEIPDGPKRPVSVGGGQMPVFSRDGRELFYASRDEQLVSVPLRPQGGRLAPAEPQPLFPLQFDLGGELPWHLMPYDVAPDGQKFLVIRRAPRVEPDGVVVLSNWTPGSPSGP